MAVGEWDQRQLCPDGGCVGVIGPDGTCKVCGRAAQNWGDERKRGLIDPPDEDEDDDDDLEEDDARAAAGNGDDDSDEYDDEDDDAEDDDHDDAGAGEADHALTAPPEWSGRRLCADGSCIGLLGPDGRCKVCGRSPAEFAPAAATHTGEHGDDAPAGHGPETTTRAVCADISCTGAIGPDGRCEVCGKVAA